MDFDLLPFVKRPSRYLGCEIHAIRPSLKENDLHVGMAFPDLYEIGMSHLGLNLLYHSLNQQAGIVAERVFMPDADLEALLRSRNIPLTTLETRTPLHKLDILGFTLAYELTYTNTLGILDLGGIPLRTEERSANHPLILAGGPCAFNPEPMSAFIDAFVIGEAEYRLPEICNLVSSWKAGGNTRDDLLRALSRLEGIYVPSLFTWEQQQGKNVWAIHPPSDCRVPVQKCTVPSLDTSPYPHRPIVPFTRIVHDRISMEVARGCPHGCRFCQAGNIYRPYRERSPERVLKLALDCLEATGYAELSLLGLSVGDYTGLAPLVTSLMKRLESRKISLSLPSLRVGSLDPAVAEQILRVRRTGFTMAPEAASVRLRNIVNKDIDEEELFRTAQMLARLGWRKLKLYFMIGLPGEEESDVEAIVHLARKIRKHARSGRSDPFQVTVNVSTFVPKPHTPFQWEAQLSRKEAEERQNFLKKRLRRPGFRFKWNDPRVSLLEGMFSRGDRRLCGLVENAYRLGCRMDAWSEYLRFDLWEKAFDLSSINPEACLHPFPRVEDPLPWDWVDTGIGKPFLLQERTRAFRAERTPLHCSGHCEACGICERPMEGVERESPIECGPDSGNGAQSFLPEPFSLKSHVPAARIRIVYSKLKPAVYLSHLETINVFYRALHRTGLPIYFTEGEHPHPKVSFSTALPVNLESHTEYMDIWVSKSMDTTVLAESLDRELPDGFSVFASSSVPLKAPSLEESIAWMEYEITLPERKPVQPSRKDLDQALSDFQQGRIVDDRDGRPAKTSLKNIHQAAKLESLDGTVGFRCRIYKLSGSLPSPVRVVEALSPRAFWENLRVRIVKTQTVFLDSALSAALQKENSVIRGE